MPLEAKNRKGIIFGSEYDTIFSSTTNAEKLLLPFELFNEIETYRTANATGRRSWLAYASYHILFAIKRLAEKKGIDLKYSNRGKISALLDKAIAIVGKARNRERKKALKSGEEFADVLFFKQNLAKEAIQALV
jgi:hypothetical protein